MGRQARGRGAGAFGAHPAERLCFSQPLSDPSDRPELQGNYGNVALKPSMAFFHFFPRTKAIRDFYEPCHIKLTFLTKKF